MKSLSKYLALLATVACLGTLTARAEGEGDEKKPAPKHERGGDKERPERPKLTDEEKAKLKAAHEAAQKDPAVIKAKEALKKAHEDKDREAAQAARKALAEAVKAAMLKADPSLAALLEKHPGLVHPKGGRGEGRPGRPGKDGEGHPERGPKKDAPEKSDK